MVSGFRGFREFRFLGRPTTGTVAREYIGGYAAYIFSAVASVSELVMHKIRKILIIEPECNIAKKVNRNATCVRWPLSTEHRWYHCTKYFDLVVTGRKYVHWKVKFKRSKFINFLACLDYLKVSF